MSSYRFWIDRHKLGVWLEYEKRKLESVHDSERKRRLLELERDFRIKLDEIYGRVRLEFEAGKA